MIGPAGFMAGPKGVPTHREELLATAFRLREQARRLRISADFADSGQARSRDIDEARNLERKAAQMEKEAASPYGHDGPCQRPGCNLIALCPDCGPSLIDYHGE